MEVTLKTDSERFSDDTGKGEEQKEKQDISEKSLDSEFAEDEDDACYDDPEGFVDNISDEGNEDAPDRMDRVRILSAWVKCHVLLCSGVWLPVVTD